MSGLVKKYTKFKKDQDGTATIEFVLLFPAFMFLFLMGFESGYYMVRGVMLERAVDVAVRDVRLANGNVPELEDFKTNICNVATILPDCESSLQVEIRPVAPVPGGVAAAGSQVGCIDKRADLDDDANATTYDTGSGNQLMLVRVCALASPLFPTTGIGAGMRYDNFGNYALVAMSAFVNEPSDSTDRAEVAIASMGAPIGNNGFGNGDQDAPGESLETNQAENDQTPTTNGGANNKGGSTGGNNSGSGDDSASSNTSTNNNNTGGGNSGTGGNGGGNTSTPGDDDDASTSTGGSTGGTGGTGDSGGASEDDTASDDDAAPAPVINQ